MHRCENWLCDLINMMKGIGANLKKFSVANVKRPTYDPPNTFPTISFQTPYMTPTLTLNLFQSPFLTFPLHMENVPKCMKDICLVQPYNIPIQYWTFWNLDFQNFPPGGLRGCCPLAVPPPMTLSLDLAPAGGPHVWDLQDCKHICQTCLALRGFKRS